jgi:hypothetical protein
VTCRRTSGRTASYDGRHRLEERGGTLVAAVAARLADAVTYHLVTRDGRFGSKTLHRGAIRRKLDFVVEVRLPNGAGLGEGRDARCFGRSPSLSPQGRAVLGQSLDRRIAQPA